MPFGGALTAGIGGLLGGLGGLFGGGKQQTVNTSNNTSTNMSGTGTSNSQGSFANTGNTTGTSSTNPNLSPLQQALMKSFTSGASDLYNQSTNLKPYTDSSLENIAGSAQGTDTAIQNQLAARGQQFSPSAGTAQTQNTLNTANQNTQLLNSVPLLQRQLQQQALQQLMGAFQVLPTGTTTTSSGQTNQSGTQNQSGQTTANQQGTSSSQGTQGTYGNPTAGLIGGLGSGLFAGGDDWLQNLFNNPTIGKDPSGGGSVAPLSFFG